MSVASIAPSCSTPSRCSAPAISRVVPAKTGDARGAKPTASSTCCTPPPCCGCLILLWLLRWRRRRGGRRLRQPNLLLPLLLLLRGNWQRCPGDLVVCNQTIYPRAHRTTPRINTDARRSLLLQHACLERGGPSSGAYPAVRVGGSLPSRTWGSLPLPSARCCCLSGRLPP